MGEAAAQLTIDRIEVGSTVQVRRAPQSQRLRQALVVTDGAVIAVAWMFALTTWGGPPSPGARLVVAAGATGMTLALLALHQLYLARVCRVRAVELRRLAWVCALAGLAVHVGARAPGTELERAGITAGAVLSFGALAVARGAFASWLRACRIRGRATRPVVIVGDNGEAEELHQLLVANPGLGFLPVARCRPADVAGVLLREDADAVVVAISAVDKLELNRMIRRLLGAGIHVHLSCGLTGIDHRRLRPLPLAHEPMFYVEPITRAGWQLVLSRMIDVVGAAVGLIASLPVLAVAAIAIKLEDGGPVLFRQQRIGKDGRPFVLYKLRTMVPGAEALLPLVQGANRRDGPLYKADDDPRISRVGRLLRAASIDELPQLLNVLNGTMSLVGPRPALAHEVAQFDDELLDRHRVRPGITGLWQVEARHDPSFQSYRRLDLFYLENWSLMLDLVILVATGRGLLSQTITVLRSR